jgi:hypothetical protein
MFDVVATVVGSAAVLGPFLMVVGIVWVRSRTQLEEKRIAATAARDAASLPVRDDGRVDELEERVRILERIVTDRGYDVATQIEALRDARGIDTPLDVAAPQGSI